jgi:uncharacterized repeat protein (TIGR02543 family)
LISALTLPQGTNITPPANPTRQGFAFLGWHLDQQLLQPISIPQTMPGYSFSLYAKWAINSYTIEFQTNGGTPINPLILSSNELIQPFTQSTTKTEHNFVDWYLDDTLTIPFDFRFMPPYNLTLYAKWTVNQYTITFNTNGGNSISSQTNNFGSLLVIPTPTRSGYSFIGWFTDSNLTQAAPATTPAGNITFHAKWIVNYTITFNTNGGNSIPTQTSYFGDPLVVPTPTRSGYTFAGWFTDSNLTQEAPVNMPGADMTLYAKWTINQYTITFTSNGGSAVNPITQDFGTAVSAPTNPTRSEYIFDGWFTDEALSNLYIFPSIMPSEDITVYAKWIFFSNQGSSFSTAIMMLRSTSYIVNITSSRQLVYFRFTPTSSGTYTFSSSGSSDTFGTLYSASQTIIVSDDDNGTGFNFRISRSLTANSTYYLVASLYGSGTGSFTVSVT